MTGLKRAFFYDTIQAKVDAKNRVSVPADYREVLSAFQSELIAYRSFSAPCIECCPSVFMEQLAESIYSSFPVFSEAGDDLSRLLLAESKVFPVDGTGRMVLTEKLKNHAQLEGAALFVGLGKRFQIWAPGLFAEEEKKMRERIAQTRPTLQFPTASPREKP